MENRDLIQEKEGIIIKSMKEAERIISMPIENFKDLSYANLELMQHELICLSNRLKDYADMLGDIKHFKKLWDGFNNKDSFEKIFLLFSDRLQRDEPPSEDDIPF